MSKNISDILSTFVNHDEDLFSAATSFMQDGLNIWLTNRNRHDLKEYFKNAITTASQRSAYARILSIYELGETRKKGKDNTASEWLESKYDYIRVLVCDANCDLQRSDIVALTLALSHDREENPLLLLLKKGKYLSLSVCERKLRRNSEESLGKVIILHEIDCGNPSKGHVQILEGLAKNAKKSHTVEDLFKSILSSLSIDTVSDNFFKGYTELFKEFSDYASEDDAICQAFSGFDDPKKAIRDYVKLLMGRLVFIQFLQRKGWMGVPEDDESWETGDPEFVQNLYEDTTEKSSFIHDVLNRLFRDLNTKRERDLCSVKKGVKVPYLNGGLFDNDEFKNIQFALPADKIQNLLKFFRSYNFTIDENSDEATEVGVDPEMLSRIFESLLEEQEKKDKGAVYTPKEIVDYMCQESLLAYLQLGVNEDRKIAYKEFLENRDKSVLHDAEKTDIDRKLRDAKICDPAIGSGAFPMGMLKLLFECRKSLEMNEDGWAPSEVKKEIIQNNIYGVDIEKGAVDIARLRFWLALIIDEKTPHALPNMDFKIMQGNSLLEQYEGVDFSKLELEESKKSGGRRRRKNQQPGDQVLVFDEQDALKNIQSSIQSYYTTDDHNSKSALRSQINDNIKSYICHLNGSTPEIKRQIERLDIPNDKFFLWHIYFKEVFDKGGFDIVIGNPPYFVHEGNNTSNAGILREIPEYKIALGGKMNAYQFFLAHALKCLVKPSGINCFIIQNAFMADREAKNLRNYVLSDCHILKIDSFPERDSTKKRVFKNAKMSACIVLICNEKYKGRFDVNIWDDKNKTSGVCTSYTKSEIEEFDPKYYSIGRISEDLKPVIRKMLKHRDINIEFKEGELNVSTDKKYFCDDDSLPVIMKGAGIQRYYHTYEMSQGKIEYLKEEEYLAENSSKKKALDNRKRRIVMQGMASANAEVKLIMTILPAGIYLAHSCKYVMPIEELSLECILGILNSKLANLFFWCFSTNSNINGYEVENIPIPSLTAKQADLIHNDVIEILHQKEANSAADTSSIEHEIDCLLYEVYGLTNGEVKIVDPEIETFGADFELYKVKPDFKMKTDEEIKEIYRTLVRRFDWISQNVNIESGNSEPYNLNGIGTPRTGELEDAFAKWNCGILTAYRDSSSDNKETQKRNRARNEELKGKLTEQGFLFRAVDGVYLEVKNEEGDTKEVEVTELSFFVTNTDKTGRQDLSEEEFFRKLYRLSEHYEQDSFLFTFSGNNRIAFLVATNKYGRDWFRNDNQFAGPLDTKNVESFSSWTGCENGKLAFRLKGIVQKQLPKTEDRSRKVYIGEGDLFDTEDYNPEFILLIHDEDSEQLNNLKDDYKKGHDNLHEYIFSQDALTSNDIKSCVKSQLDALLGPQKLGTIGFHCSAKLNGSYTNGAKVAKEAVIDWAFQNKGRFEKIVIVNIFEDFTDFK